MENPFRRTGDFLKQQWPFPVLVSGDSRLMALLAMGGKRISNSGRAGRFVGVSLAAALLAYWGHQSALNLSQVYILFLALWAIGLWLTEAIPPFAVGILIIGFLVFSQGALGAEGEQIRKYVDTWSSPVIWLLLGGFFLAEGMRKTGLDQALFHFTFRLAGDNPRRLLGGLMLTTGLASMVMSNTSTAAMMLASVLPMIKARGAEDPLSKALLLGIPAAASLGGMGTIIGSAPNAVAVGALQAQGIAVDFLDWMAYGIPPAMALLALFYFFLLRAYRLPRVWTNPPLPSRESETPAPIGERRTVLLVTALTIALWISTPWHGIPVAVISGLPIVLLTLTSVLYANDVRRLPWDTLMLVAGGLALGLALVDSGLAALLLSQLQLDIPLPLLILVFGLVTVLLSNIMSNTATASILVPLGLMLLGGQSEETGIMAVLIALAASCALFLPVSTPPNAIAFSTGLLQQKDFYRGGLLAALLGPSLSLLWLLLLQSF